MFIDAQRRFGTEKVDEFLERLYLRFRDRRIATTVLFLEDAENEIGPEASGFFSAYLYATKLPPDELK